MTYAALHSKMPQIFLFFPPKVEFLISHSYKTTGKDLKLQFLGNLCDTARHVIRGVGFPPTQLYLNIFYYSFLSHYMFRSYDHLQVEIYNAMGMQYVMETLFH
jgi:hypothetical protein